MGLRVSSGGVLYRWPFRIAKNHTRLACGFPRACSRGAAYTHWVHWANGAKT